MQENGVVIRCIGHHHPLPIVSSVRDHSTGASRLDSSIQSSSPIGSPGGTATMRGDDHQLQLGQFISRWQPVDARYPVGAEGTGHTFAPLQYIAAPVLSQPVRCNLPRP